MNDSFRNPPVKTIVAVIAAMAVGFGIARLDFGSPILPAALSAQADQTRAGHTGAEDHARNEAALREAMSGPVDVYFDVTEIETAEPSLAGVRFTDLVDVTGKELLRFQKGTKEQWLIDPDMVLTFRINTGNSKTGKGERQK